MGFLKETKVEKTSLKIQTRPKTPFTVDKNPTNIFFVSFCLQWERLQLTIIIGSNGSTFGTGNWTMAHE